MHRKIKSFPVRDEHCSGGETSGGGALLRRTRRVFAPHDPVVTLDGLAIRRLRHLQKISGRTPAQIAQRARVPVHALEDLLSNKQRVLRSSHLRAIARELGTYPGKIHSGHLSRGEQTGERLTRAMAADNVTVKQLSQRTAERGPIHVVERVITRIRNGQVESPSKDTLESLACALGIEVDALLPATVSPATVLETASHLMPPPAPLLTPPSAPPRSETLSDVRSSNEPALPRRWVWAMAAAAVAIGALVGWLRDGDGALAIDPYPQQTRFESEFAWNGEPFTLFAFHMPHDEWGSFAVHRTGDAMPVVTDVPRNRSDREITAILGSPRKAHLVVKQTYRRVTQRVADLTDDRGNELVVILEGAFDQSPAVVRAFTTQGELVMNYYVVGRIDDILIDDIDGNGKNEIVIGAQSIDVDERGPRVIVLDAEHADGVSPDGVAIARSPVVDGARAWVQLDAFDARSMSLLRGDRLRVWSLWRSPIAGRRMLVAEVGVEESSPVFLYLDDSLAPVRAEVTDALRANLRMWSNADSARFMDMLDDWASRTERGGGAIDSP